MCWLKNKVIAKILIWLVAEILLNFVGIDDLADYSEFVFENNFQADMVSLSWPTSNLLVEVNGETERAISLCERERVLRCDPDEFYSSSGQTPRRFLRKGTLTKRGNAHQDKVCFLIDKGCNLDVD